MIFMRLIGGGEQTRLPVEQDNFARHYLDLQKLRPQRLVQKLVQGYGFAASA